MRHNYPEGTFTGRLVPNVEVRFYENHATGMLQLVRLVDEGSGPELRPLLNMGFVCGLKLGERIAALPEGKLFTLNGSLSVQVPREDAKVKSSGDVQMRVKRLDTTSTRIRNEVVIEGNTVADVDIRPLQNQKAVVSLRLANNPHPKPEEGEQERPTNFFRVDIWEKDLQDLAVENIPSAGEGARHRARIIKVRGQLRQQFKKADAEAGTEARRYWSVSATDLEFVDNFGDTTATAAPRVQAPAAQVAPAPQAPTPVVQQAAQPPAPQAPTAPPPLGGIGMPWSTAA